MKTRGIDLISGRGRRGASGRPWIFCFLAVLVLTAFSSACRYDMQDQPKYKPLRRSNFFTDGQSARPLVDGTVPRGFVREDSPYYTGKTGAGGGAAPSAARTPAAQPGTSTAPAAGAATSPAGTGPGATSPAATGPAGSPGDVTVFPFPVTQQVLDRGQERFNIFCAPCHGRMGNGDGMVVRRGYRPPPSYHIDRLRQAPAGHFFDVITNGFGAMPDYSAQVPPEDRWAIIAYIRALQLSQNSTMADVPADSKGQLTNPEGQK